jgi:hypothetical protein
VLGPFIEAGFDGDAKFTSDGYSMSNFEVEAAAS